MLKPPFLIHCSVLSEPYQYLKTSDRIPHPLRNSLVGVLYSRMCRVANFNFLLIYFELTTNYIFLKLRLMDLLI